MPLIEPLEFQDEVLAELALPTAPLRILRGLGSGLTRDPRDPGRIWAIGDRGPNMKLKVAAKRYGVALDGDTHPKGAKLMPALEHGPALVALRLDGNRVLAERVLPLLGADGTPITGLPIPAGSHAELEPALGLDGSSLGADASGADTEGVAMSRDGRFWIGDEYGPSLLRVDADGRVFERWIPEGTADCFRGADIEIVEALPAICARRRLNRGFEAIALSADEAELHLAFQGPLSHPDEAAFRAARHVRVMTLDIARRRVSAQYAYPLDPPESFRRDRAKGEFEHADVKVSELTRLPDGRFVVLERGAETGKLYRIDLAGARALPPEHLDTAHRPTLEELSRDDPDGIPALAKELLLSTDDFPEISADLEGVTALDGRTLILVNDNDFGCEGAESRFWRVTLD